MGRNRKYFTIEEQKEANRRNQETYRTNHKEEMKDVYKISALRSYYRRKYKTASAEEKEKIEIKINELSEKLRNIKNQLNEN